MQVLRGMASCGVSCLRTQTTMARPRLGGAIWGQSWTEERCESSLEGSGRGDSGRCSAHHSSFEVLDQYMPVKAGRPRARSERHARGACPTAFNFSGRGVFHPPHGCERPWLRRLRATARAHCGGVSLAPSQANSEGSPPRGVPTRSQPEEFWAAARGDAQGPNGRVPAGQEKTRRGAPTRQQVLRAAQTLM